MSADRVPSTNAMRALRAAGAEYSPHVFDYRRFPGAAGAAEHLGVDLYEMAKTIVFVTDAGRGAVVLMHGDREVSVKKLARELGVKSVRPASAPEANRLTGYQFGGTSPLGMRNDIPVYAQESLADLSIVYVNAGSRGFLIGIEPHSLIDLTNAVLADVAVE